MRLRVRTPAWSCGGPPPRPNINMEATGGSQERRTSQCTVARVKSSHDRRSKGRNIRRTRRRQLRGQIRKGLRPCPPLKLRIAATAWAGVLAERCDRDTHNNIATTNPRAWLDGRAATCGWRSCATDPRAGCEGHWMQRTQRSAARPDSSAADVADGDKAPASKAR